MFVAITIILLLITALGLMIARMARPGFGYSWPVAAIGAFFAWVSTFLWLFRLPDTLIVSKWQPQSMFTSSPTLIADQINFPYALGITTLVLAVILTSSARATSSSPIAWAATFVLAALGLVAVLANNPLTLVLVWTILDITELANTLYIVDGPRSSESAVSAFAARMVGTWIVLLGSVVSFAGGAPLTFEAVPVQASLYLLAGVSLRIGSQIIYLPYSNESTMRRGYGTMLRLVAAASTLILLARVPEGGFQPIIATLGSIAAAIFGLAAIYNWLRASDELTGRPYWIIAISMLAIATALRGSPLGSVAWGSALIFSGGLLFLYSTYRRWLSIALLVFVFCLSSLPYSLTALSWQTESQVPWFPLILLLPFQALVIATFIRSIIQGHKSHPENESSVVRVFYPAGLLILAFCPIGLGFAGWSGALKTGAWIPAIIVTVLGVCLSILLIRIPVPESPRVDKLITRPSAAVANRFSDVLWGIYRFIGRTMSLIANTLEGDGGFLWTILLLVLFISIFQGSFR
jgi:hypothetical protein